MRNTLCDEVCPLTNVTPRRGQPSFPARNPANASFVAESTGGAVTFTFSSFPTMPPSS